MYLAKEIRNCLTSHFTTVHAFLQALESQVKGIEAKPPKAQKIQAADWQEIDMSILSWRETESKCCKYFQQLISKCGDGLEQQQVDRVLEVFTKFTA